VKQALTWRYLKQMLDAHPEIYDQKIPIEADDQNLMYFVVGMTGYDDCRNVSLQVTKFIRRD
jgi:hypothetical protein